MDISLSKLKRWETAPFNLRILEENKLTYTITSSGIKNKSDFIKNLRIAVKKGLSQKDALNALTATPAKLIGMSEKLGSLEKNKIANFIICSSNIFNDGIIYENWTGGKKNTINKKIRNDIRGYYTFNSDNFKDILVEIKGSKEKPQTKIIKIDSSNLKTTLNEKRIVIYNNAGDFRCSGIYNNGTIKLKEEYENGKAVSILKDFKIL